MKVSSSSCQPCCCSQTCALFAPVGQSSQPIHPHSTWLKKLIQLVNNTLGDVLAVVLDTTWYGTVVPLSLERVKLFLYLFLNVIAVSLPLPRCHGEDSSGSSPRWRPSRWWPTVEGTYIFSFLCLIAWKMTLPYNILHREIKENNRESTRWLHIAILENYGKI